MSYSVTPRMTSPDPLSSLLQRWQPTPAPAADFATEVRRRLAATTPAPLPAHGLLAFLQRPLALPLAAGLAVVLGVAAAMSVNRSQVRDSMADAYARNIDPVQRTAAGVTATGHVHH